jgi:hypothetical protein
MTGLAVFGRNAAMSALRLRRNAASATWANNNVGFVRILPVHALCSEGRFIPHSSHSCAVQLMSAQSRFC